MQLLAMHGSKVKPREQGEAKGTIEHPTQQTTVSSCHCWHVGVGTSCMLSECTWLLVV
jgi:hypothetical protein